MKMCAHMYACVCVYAFPVNSIFKHVRECTHRLRHVSALAIAPLEELAMPAFFDYVGFICSSQPLETVWENN